MSKRTTKTSRRPILAFQRPDAPPPLTTMEKYAALATLTPHAVQLIEHLIEHLYDEQRRRNPDLFPVEPSR